MEQEIILEARNITKVYPGGVVANHNVNLQIKKGEIHALVGENGAGKSTLMKMLFGMLAPTEGQIFVDGKEVHFSSSSDAIAAGLASNNTGDHLKIVDVPDTTWSYGIAVKSGQDELVGQIDAALRAMVKDGSWQKAAADMGKSIGYTPDASMNPPKATAKAPSSGTSAASEK